MSLFFRTISVDEAREIARQLGSPVGTEEVPLEMAAGRVLASQVKADLDIPGFSRSVVDGYAVRATDTVGASDAIPAMLALAGRVSMGSQDTLVHMSPREERSPPIPMRWRWWNTANRSGTRCW